MNGNGYGFNTPKQTLLTYNLIADFEERKLLMIKLIGNKCVRKVISSRAGLTTSLWSIKRNYNDNLEHKNGKIKIIAFEIL